ncbi:MAG: hypothetical protein NWP80_00355 [Candidatus Gracilibacteria bacterium]|nr:hypothetical protein [Candidatus Gracilibacteria bacterium]
MGKNKILIEPSVKDKIESSVYISNSEKNNLLKYIAYFTNEEKEELLLMI